jgi:hypothetical protein
MAEAFHVRRSVEVIAHMRVPPAIAGRDYAKNSPFGERRILNVSQRSESSQTATAYRCSPGIGRSFIKPTLGVAESGRNSIAGTPAHHAPRRPHRPPTRRPETAG